MYTIAEIINTVRHLSDNSIYITKNVFLWMCLMRCIMIYLIMLYSETHYLNFRASPLASKETPVRYQSPSIPILSGPCNHKHIYFSLDFPILKILNRITQYLTFFTLFIWHSDFRAYLCCSLSINKPNFFFSFLIIFFQVLDKTQGLRQVKKEL